MFAISKYRDDNNIHLFEHATFTQIQLWFKTAEKDSYIIWNRQPNSWVSMLYVTTVGQITINFM